MHGKPRLVDRERGRSRRGHCGRQRRAGVLRLGVLDPRAAFLAAGAEDEGLEREAVNLGVDAADERANRPAGDLLHRLAELPGGRLLREHPGVAQTLMLAHLHQIALGVGQRVLQNHR